MNPTPSIDRLATPVVLSAPTAIDLGRMVCYVNCMPCHGDRGQGLTDEWRAAELIAIMPNRLTFFHHLHPVMLPARESRFRYTFGLGGLSVFLFVVLALTGTLELFYYILVWPRRTSRCKRLRFLCRMAG